MSTGENDQALRKIIDFTRMGSIIVLTLLFYISCYGAFEQWHLSSVISDRIMISISHLEIFRSGLMTKSLVLLLLSISLVGSKGKKEEKLNKKVIAIYITSGIAVFYLSELILLVRGNIRLVTVCYIMFSSIGYMLALTGGTWLSRLIKLNMQDDVFNNLAETFQQEERLLENKYSYNFKAKYNLKGKIRNSYVSVINPFRAILIFGTAGSGKSAFVVRHIITQSIQKGYCMLLYDYKIPDLSLIAYNCLKKNRASYEYEPAYHCIDFDDLSKSNQCNPLIPDTMLDITDAAESSSTILVGLNRDWAKRRGDFFVESGINFITAIIWFLRCYEGGKYCTVPHMIEFSQIPYEELFSCLRSEPTIESLINPFVNAFLNNAASQLEGQIASAKIGLARIASPQLYWVLNGADFSLELNDPKNPKILCLGNNPQKQQVYGAVLGLYVNRITKVINQKNKLPLAYIVDELPTLPIFGLDNLMATARSNKVSVTLALQTYEMLKRDYSQEQAEVIMNLPGNVISGQVMGETAKQLSERFGKIMQERQSKSINSNDISVSHSTQLESAIPAAKISNLSSGQFVGLVADNPDQRIPQKMFNCEFINDWEAIKREEEAYEPLPVIKKVTDEMVQQNYFQIRKDVSDIREKVMNDLRSDPGKAHLLIVKD